MITMSFLDRSKDSAVRKYVEKGTVDAQFDLEVMYYEGQGVT